MANLAFRRARFYVRTAIVLVVAGAVGVVLFQNRKYETHVWFFGLVDAERQINVVWLMICTAVASLVAWWSLVLVLRLLREYREVSKLAARQRAEKELAEREKKVEERERRLDSKVGNALADKPEPPAKEPG